MGMFGASVGSGLAQGYLQGQQLLDQRERLKLAKDQSALQAKLVDLQLRQHEYALSEAQKKAALGLDLKNLLTSPPTMPGPPMPGGPAVHAEGPEGFGSLVPGSSVPPPPPIPTGTFNTQVPDPAAQQRSLLGILAQIDPKAVVGALVPKPTQPFTLAPGARRYDAQGNVVAEAPTAQTPFTLPPGGIRFDPQGRPIVQAPAAPFNLSPGATRYTPEGHPLVTAPVTEAKPTYGPDRNAIAQDKFGKPFGQLTQAQQGVVNKAYDQFRENIAGLQGGARAAAEAGVKLDQPIAEQSRNYVHPVTLQTPPPIMSKRQVLAQGYVPVTNKDRDQLSMLEQTATIIEGVDQITQRLITARNPMEAAGQYAALKSGALTGANTLARTYEGEKQAFTGVLSRTLGGERGVLTDRDIKRITDALPNFFDTKAVRDAKIGMIRALLDVARSANKQKLLGEPIDSGAQQRIQNILDAVTKIADASQEPESTGKPRILKIVPETSR